MIMKVEIGFCAEGRAQVPAQQVYFALLLNDEKQGQSDADVALDASI